MTALPEWTEVAWKNGHERVVHHEKLKEALAIAWEALSKACKDTDHEYMTPKGQIEAKPCEFEDAMRRITELGNNEFCDHCSCPKTQCACHALGKE